MGILDYMNGGGGEALICMRFFRSWFKERGMLHVRYACFGSMIKEQDAFLFFIYVSVEVGLRN